MMVKGKINLVLTWAVLVFNLNSAKSDLPDGLNPSPRSSEETLLRVVERLESKLRDLELDVQRNTVKTNGISKLEGKLSKLEQNTFPPNILSSIARCVNALKKDLFSYFGNSTEWTKLVDQAYEEANSPWVIQRAFDSIMFQTYGQIGNRVMMKFLEHVEPSVWGVSPQVVGDHMIQLIEEEFKDPNHIQLMYFLNYFLRRELHKSLSPFYQIKFDKIMQSALPLLNATRNIWDGTVCIKDAQTGLYMYGGEGEEVGVTSIRNSTKGLAWEVQISIHRDNAIIIGNSEFGGMLELDTMHQEEVTVRKTHGFGMEFYIQVEPNQAPLVDIYANYYSKGNRTTGHLKATEDGKLLVTDTENFQWVFEKCS